MTSGAVRVSRDLCSWPAFLIVLSGIGPTFTWRARAEETLLSRTVGKRYALYQKQTKMIVPYFLSRGARSTLIATARFRLVSVAR
jgi:protein-S-isoprenylcysteine O-methyltransferase Ste14